MPIGPLGSPAPPPGQLVGQTNAANTNLPAWLQTEVARLNAQDALRTQLMGSVTGGGGPAAPAYDPNIGIAAVTNARANYNAQINQLNEQARLQNLVQQRSQLGGSGAFGFSAPFEAGRMQDLDRQIAGYRQVNLPLAAGAFGGRSSGWVGGQRYSNGLLNGTGYAF